MKVTVAFGTKIGTEGGRHMAVMSRYLGVEGPEQIGPG